jgi:hypothetical protein
MAVKKVTLQKKADAPDLSNEEPVFSLLRGAAQSAQHLIQKRNGAYQERAHVIAALSKCFPAHLTRHEVGIGESWDEDWRTVVCIHFPDPAGQGTWHIHDSEVPLFAHLEVTESDWDGHTTDEKYERLKLLDVQPSANEDGDQAAEEKRLRLKAALQAIQDRL